MDKPLAPEPGKLAPRRPPPKKRFGVKHVWGLLHWTTWYATERSREEAIAAAAKTWNGRVTTTKTDR